jgi:hypothetical protein
LNKIFVLALALAVTIMVAHGAAKHRSFAGVIKHKDDLFASDLVKARDFISFDLHVQDSKRQNLKRWLHTSIAAALVLLRLNKTVDTVFKVW